MTGSTKTIVSTGNPLVDGVLYNHAWFNTAITYKFPTTGTAYQPSIYEAYSFGAVSSNMENAIRFALDTNDGNAANDGFSLEGFTNLTVSQTSGSFATLRFGVSNEPSTAWAYSPTSNIVGGDVWFGRVTDFSNPSAGDYEWMTALHETGHALGLEHGHQNTVFGTLPAQNDSLEYSIMTYRSYVGGPTVGAFTNEAYGFPQTYMISDIAALQHMYGANYTTNSGNTVYKWSPNSGDTLVNGVVAINPGANRIFATIWDGDGIDTYDLSDYTTDLAIDLNPGGFSKFSDSQLVNLGVGEYSRGNIFNALTYNGSSASLIENAIGGSGNDEITGNLAANTLRGEGGSDILSGAAGNDILVGGGGADVLNGGAGTDTASYATSTTAQFIDLQVSGANTGSEALGDTYSGIENLVGGSGSDDIRGDAGDNFINGGAGYDSIMGRDGDDILLGGLGGDTLDGGAGADVLNGGSGDDWLLGQTGNDRLVGASGDDRLLDYSGNNTMLAGAGADTLFDGIGDSLLNGGDGNDRLFGAVGIDQLFGGAGDDLLSGGIGDDVLQGDQGNDLLLGGAGADSFVFNGEIGADIVSDFTLGQDHLSISSVLAGGLSSAADIVSTYATVVGNNLELDFGNGNEITLIGFNDIAAISGAIVLIA